MEADLLLPSDEVSLLPPFPAHLRGGGMSSPEGELGKPPVIIGEDEEPLRARDGIVL